ncbi:MAG: R.Pab1 family restriction endonuclease [Cardiobacteriaceae bacterium]|nr:R.Pab1 family restriction endonuclease [Cardiobacteriaceae bacterium]
MKYEFPLSQATGKIRIKERLAFSDYGQPVAPTKTIITPKHYIEWQIGYDRIVEKNETVHFVGANGKNKQIYELSEFLQFGLQENIIKYDELKELRNTINRYSIFIDEKEKINREHFISENINNIEFLKSRVSYPLLIHKFQIQDSLCEIIVREKQRAVGTMPMLYFCVPLSVLQDKDGKYSFIGRNIKSKENGYLLINSNNIKMFMKMFQIFGMLSVNHQKDCLSILDYLLK